MVSVSECDMTELQIVWIGEACGEGERGCWETPLYISVKQHLTRSSFLEVSNLPVRLAVVLRIWEDPLRDDLFAVDGRSYLPSTQCSK